MLKYIMINPHALATMSAAIANLGEGSPHHKMASLWDKSMNQESHAPAHLATWLLESQVSPQWIMEQAVRLHPPEQSRCLEWWRNCANHVNSKLFERRRSRDILAIPRKNLSRSSRQAVPSPLTQAHRKTRWRPVIETLLNTIDSTPLLPIHHPVWTMGKEMINDALSDQDPFEDLILTPTWANQRPQELLVTICVELVKNGPQFPSLSILRQSLGDDVTTKVLIHCPKKWIDPSLNKECSSLLPTALKIIVEDWERPSFSPFKSNEHIRIITTLLENVLNHDPGAPPWAQDVPLDQWHKALRHLPQTSHLNASLFALHQALCDRDLLQSTLTVPAHERPAKKM